MHRRLMSLIAALFLVPVVVTSAHADEPPVLRSTIGQFVFLRPLRQIPAAPLRGVDGNELSLDHFRGKMILLNFWATWCAPCLREMPALDRLAASDTTHLAVVAISIDEGGTGVVASFVAAQHWTSLVVGLDPDRRFGSPPSGGNRSAGLPIWGLPITYLVDARRGVLGYLVGAADWDSPAVRGFLNAFVSVR